MAAGADRQQTIIYRFEEGVAIVYLKSGVGRREIVDSVKGQVSWRLWEERQGKGWFS